MILKAGDFVVIPSADGFTMSSIKPAQSENAPVLLANGEFRLGDQTGAPEIRLLVGHCVFGSPDAALLVSLLPKLVHVQREHQLATLVELVAEESRQQRPARDFILSRLLEVLLIEALRSTEGTVASRGLMRGLADERIADAIRRMHKYPMQSFTVAQLAKDAGLSRSAFFERFNRVVGVAPMEYLLAWRMALAQKLLRQNGIPLAEVAERIGYSSASTFSVAFTRYVGVPPTRYARENGRGQLNRTLDRPAI